ncbi:P-loop containing nucleoside triphosphate hydrolase protein [Amanita muscaria]
MENVELPPEVTPVVAGLTPQTLAFASFIVAAVLLALIVLFNSKKSSKRGDALLIVGASDSGKTAIWSSLAYGQTPLTHASLQANSTLYTLPESKKALRVIDIPGHPRLRGQFQEYLPNAKAIAFVVDANTISRNGAAVAEHLHHVLSAITSLPPSQAPSLLILAHKVDLLSSFLSTSDSARNLAINRVKTILERELEKRRAAHANSVTIEGLGEEGERTELGGLECTGSANSTFKFNEWEGGDVIFLATSVKVQGASQEKEKIEDQEPSGLTDLTNWLEEFCNSSL